MRRIMMFLAMVFLLAAIAVPAALAAGNEESTPLPQNSYCLNGENVALPAPVSFGDVTRMLSQTVAEIVITDPEFNGMFWMGYLEGTTTVVLAPPDLRDALADTPPPSFNTVARGSCAKPVAQPDRNFWLCYSRHQVDPAVYSRSDAVRLYDDGKGYWVPYAVKAAVSKTNIGNGVYLTCSIPAGYAVTGNAVSTGGGEPFDSGLYAKVSAANRLDYTVLLARS